MKKIILLCLCLSLYFGAQAADLHTISTSAGNLATDASAYLSTVTDLTITGTIDAQDFKTMRDNMPMLATLNISAVNIAAYEGIGGTGGTSSILYPVNEIPQNAFYNNSTSKAKISLTSIKLPESSTFIGEWALFSCTGLQGKLTIPDLVTEIKPRAFSGCTNISSLVLGNGLITIGHEAFSSCTNLKCNLVIPNLVTSIGEGAFWNCSGLTGGLIIDKSVISIGKQAFEKCGNLTSLTLGSSVTTIGFYCFRSCIKLKSIVFGASLTTDDSSVFDNIVLESLTITTSASALASSAFFPFAVYLITLDDNNPNYSLVDGVLFNNIKQYL